MLKHPPAAKAPAPAPGCYAPLKSVQKTMAILEELSRHPARRVRELSQATAIPAPTVVRVLETLCAMNYAARLPHRAGYCIAERAGRLAEGLQGLPAILPAARTAAEALTAALRWPASICTPEGAAMVVRYSTIPNSPLAHKPSTVNHRLSLLTRAHGRAWLAWCDEAERAQLLTALVHEGEHPGPVTRLAAEIEPVLTSARVNGVARRDPSLEPETMTLAAPVLSGGRLMATLGITHFIRAVPDPLPLVRRLRALALEAGRACETEGGTR
ncbi:helix-turn-helix domain-containing protein [Oceanicola sp. D3]|uniref:helix-turn-helix domain-containing protein n=1 Tax=Oceanicola sp. D3 TaxID=2587163 RepID=UPI00112234EC|nr:helix-turn-helix domain-containing protein [Oceanicola sp. D3]QDC10071.1 helix-turn-helix domain-containing protein [Oceanicola sp. D3]